MRKITVLGYEPAVLLYAANAVLAVLVSFGLGLDPDQVDAFTVLGTAGFAVLTAVLTRPVPVSVITGALATMLSAVGAFGLELDPGQQGSLVTAVSVVLMLLLRINVTPAPVLQNAVRHRSGRSPSHPV